MSGHWLGDLGVPELASLVDLLRSETDIGHGGGSIPVRKTFRPTRRNLPTLLGRIVLIGEATLGRRWIYAGVHPMSA